MAWGGASAKMPSGCQKRRRFGARLTANCFGFGCGSAAIGAFDANPVLLTWPPVPLFRGITALQAARQQRVPFALSCFDRKHLQFSCPSPGEITMQDDVVALFAYDRWANRKVLDARGKLTAEQ
jgi:hypothetical protein